MDLFQLDDDLYSSYAEGPSIEDFEAKNTDDIQISIVLDCVEDEPCSICYNPYCDGQLQTTLPCGHVFHLDCVSTWVVQGKRTCPLDRRCF
jgi:hypothetical protein